MQDRPPQLVKIFLLRTAGQRLHLMSALPQKWTLVERVGIVRLVPKADIGTQPLTRREEQEEEDADVTDIIGGDIENKGGRVN
jgi:hypothetical protein